MAGYYTQFSWRVDLDEGADLIEKLIEAANEDDRGKWFGSGPPDVIPSDLHALLMEMNEGDGNGFYLGLETGRWDHSLLVYADDCGDVWKAAYLIGIGMRKEGKEGRFTGGYATSCSKMRVGEFSGGSATVTYTFAEGIEVVTLHAEPAEIYNSRQTKDGHILPTVGTG